MSGRTIVVGDIHGCYDELLDLLSLIQFRQSDQIIAVGDLITKGPANRAVLDRFITDSRFASVIGNHDLALLRHWKGEDVKLSRAQKTAVKELESAKQKYHAYLAGLPFWIDRQTYLVVHAGIRPGIPLATQSPDDLTTLRTLGPKPTSGRGVPWYRTYDGTQKILFGHWPARRPRLGINAVGLDTGCVYGHRLTAFAIDTAEFVSVPARAAYARKRMFSSQQKTAPTKPEAHMKFATREDQSPPIIASTESIQP